MARIATFTPASIDALRKGKLHDPRAPGLTIEVLPSGKKVWKYERRLAGEPPERLASPQPTIIKEPDSTSEW